jgi:hypothetical protein
MFRDHVDLRRHVGAIEVRGSKEKIESVKFDAVDGRAARKFEHLVKTQARLSVAAAFADDAGPSRVV